MFKNKVKRSEWMEGLLYAESLSQQGYKINHPDDQPLTFRNELGDISWTWNHTEYSKGMLDYIHHKEKTNV